MTIKTVELYKSISQKRALHLAINSLDSIDKNLCAKNIHYKKLISITLAIVVLISLAPQILFYLSNAIYLIQNIFKLFLTTISYKYESHISLLPKILPKYTILIPLYKEVGNIQILNVGLHNLNYPQSLLDVIILLEQDDKETLKAIHTIKNRPAGRLVIVPDAFPKTKPKALNYGFYFSVGQYVAVYDAEDVPDPNQLFDALTTFNTGQSNLACVQCKLNFYNAQENSLTKLLAIEYTQWFSFLLPGLLRLDAPVTLGGTSNHFKRNILEKVGLWDPYNVTEDADLGIRLYNNDYRVTIIHSYTLEEAPIEPLSWIRQRSRWIKGFIQTISVYIKSIKRHQLNIKSFVLITVFFIMGTCSFFLIPIIIFLIAIDIAIPSIWIYTVYFSLMYIYTIFYLSIRDLRNTKATRIYNSNRLYDIVCVFIWPFYFILHSIAAYLALIQLFFAPFKWNKTPHGISKIIGDKEL